MAHQHLSLLHGICSGRYQCACPSTKMYSRAAIVPEGAQIRLIGELRVRLRHAADVARRGRAVEDRYQPSQFGPKPLMLSSIRMHSEGAATVASGTP